MKWNLRWAAARRDIWRPSDLLTAFEEVGFTPSLSKVAALWSGKPISVRLDDLDKMCAALGCTVADLLEAEPLADAGEQGNEQRAARRPPGLPGRHHHGAGPGDRCRRTDRCLLPGTGRSGSARSAWAGASCASAPACPACAKWRRAFPRQQDCLRCGHRNHVSPEGLCRPCLQVDPPRRSRLGLQPSARTASPARVPVRGGRPPKAARAAPSRSAQGTAHRRETLGQVVPTPAKWTWLARRPLSPADLTSPRRSCTAPALRSAPRLELPHRRRT